MSKRKNDGLYVDNETEGMSNAIRIYITSFDD
jgi:hypothetical protein